MKNAYIGLGANLGEPEKKLNQALSLLAAHHDIQLIKSSSLYRSKPIGQPDQPAYINAVANVATLLSPHALLRALLALEAQLGRTRDGVRWGPRVIDLDLLYVDDYIITDHELTLPHPEILNREFVLFPLAEIEPDFILPNGQLLSKILDNCPSDGLERIALE